MFRMLKFGCILGIMLIIPVTLYHLYYAMYWTSSLIQSAVDVAASIGVITAGLHTMQWMLFYSASWLPVVGPLLPFSTSRLHFAAQTATLTNTAPDVVNLPIDSGDDVWKWLLAGTVGLFGVILKQHHKNHSFLYRHSRRHVQGCSK